MGARGRVNTNQRRPARDAGYRSRAGGGGGTSQTPPLPASAVEYWHSELGASAANAVGQIVGVTLPGTGSPTVAADGALFNGRPVYQCATTGSKGWGRSGFPAIVAAGTRPYMCAVMRTRTLEVAGLLLTAGVCARGGDAAPTLDLGVLAFEGNGVAGGFSSYRNRDSVQTRATSPYGTQDTSPHFFEAYIDAAAGQLLFVDGVQVAANAAVTSVSTAAVTMAAIGAIWGGGGAGSMSNFGNTSLGFWLICSAVPSAGERAALLAWAQAYWFPPQQPPLPASAVAAWHSEINCSAASWTDYIGGRVLAGAFAPTVATDPGFFNGRVVGKSTSAGGACWRGTGLSGLPTAGSFPWTMAIFRLRDASVPAAEIVCAIGRDASNDDARFLASPTSFISATTGGVNLVGPALDTAVHKFKAWKDGVNRNFVADAALFTAADATPLAANQFVATIGSGAAFPADASVAFFLVCSAKPSAAEEAALDAWAQAYFGAP